MHCLLLKDAFEQKKAHVYAILSHQSLKMPPVKCNETTVCATVPLKVGFCESSDGVTFTSPAESIKKSNLGMLAKAQNQIMPEHRSLRFVGNLLNWDIMLNTINLIRKDI